MKIALCHALALLSTMACAGCGSTGSAPEPTAADEVFTRTMVFLNPDGTQTVKHDTVTKSEQLSALAELPAASPTGSAGVVPATSLGWCSATDIKLFGGTGCTGAEICFRGQGTATLADYPYSTLCDDAGQCQPLCTAGGGTWADCVRSYRAGNEDGYIHGLLFRTVGNEPFARWQTCTNAGFWASRGVSVNLTD